MSSIGYIQGLGGKGGYPPNWNEIGYSDTPYEIISAFNYAKSFQGTWTVNQKFTGDKKLFYFPTLDMSEYGLYNSYFDSSNLMHIDPITIGYASGSGTPNCQAMFKSTLIGKIKVSAKNVNQQFNTNNMFNLCLNLEEAELNLVSSNIQNMFGGCKSLTTISGTFNTASATTAYTCFEDCSSLVTAPSIDLTSVTTCYRMFHNCVELVTVPSYTFSSCTNLQQFFWNCSKLENVGVFSIPSATNISNMFQGTGNSLTETSRDNILQMCISATSYTGTKTLAQLGFTSSMYSAASWQALTHYSDFTTAGWSVGY